MDMRIKGSENCRRALLGQPHFPPMSAFGVTALIEPEARLEIEATAVVPD